MKNEILKIRKEHKPFLIVLGLSISYYFMVKKYQVLPVININLYTMIIIGVGVFYMGSQLFNIYKMMIEDTDWIKTEDMHITCTRLEIKGDWAIFFCGGWRSMNSLLDSSDGNKLIIVPNNSFIKKGRVYDIRSAVNYCPNGIYSFSGDVYRYLVDNKFESKKCYFGNEPNSLFYFNGETLPNNYVETLHGHLTAQNEYVNVLMKNFESFIKGFTILKENLTDNSQSKNFLDSLKDKLGGKTE